MDAGISASTFIVDEWSYMDRSGMLKSGDDCWQEYRQ